MALSIIGFFLFLSRIDTGLWLLALAIELLLARKKKGIGELIRPLALFAAALFLWLVFLKMYFGSIVPQSVVGQAVSHGAFMLPDWHYVLTLLSAFVPAQRMGVWGLMVIAVVFVALVPSAIDLWRRYPKLRPVLYFFSALRRNVSGGSRAAFFLVPDSAEMGVLSGGCLCDLAFALE